MANVIRITMLAAAIGWGSEALCQVVASKPALTLRGHADVVLRVVFNPDGKLVASASGDGTIAL